MFLIAGSVYLSIYAAINLPCHPLLSALLALAIYFVTASLSAVITVFLSLLLGRTDKLVLRKKTRYFVRERTDDYFKVLFNDGAVAVIPISEITETRTDTEELCPYIEIEHYNIGRWRKLLLLPVYEDTLKCILYLPSEDGT
jgi:hypothetical protein